MTSASSSGEKPEETPAVEAAATAEKPTVRDREMRDAGLALLTVVLSLLVGFVVAQVVGITRSHNPQFAIPADEIGVFVCVISLVGIPGFLRQKPLNTLLVFSGVVFFLSGVLLALTV